MTGPRKPFPITCPGDLQAREEVERLLALEDAQREVEALLEAQAEAADLPIETAEVEKVDRDYEYMQTHDDFALYSEWGIVR